MKVLSTLATALALLLVPEICCPQARGMQGSAPERSGIADGEAGARAGTLIYNANTSTPLPVSGGDVVKDTIKNVGAGQSPGQAWTNAAAANAGLPAQNSGPDAQPVDDSTPQSGPPEASDDGQ